MLLITTIIDFANEFHKQLFLTCQSDTQLFITYLHKQTPSIIRKYACDKDVECFGLNGIQYRIPTFCLIVTKSRVSKVTKNIFWYYKLSINILSNLGFQYIFLYVVIKLLE